MSSRHRSRILLKSLQANRGDVVIYDSFFTKGIDIIKYNSGHIVQAFRALFGQMPWWRPKLQKDQKFHFEKMSEVP
jgi:hypothetical protein